MRIIRIYNNALIYLFANTSKNFANIACLFNHINLIKNIIGIIRMNPTITSSLKTQDLNQFAKNYYHSKEKTINKNDFENKGSKILKAAFQCDNENMDIDLGCNIKNLITQRNLSGKIGVKLWGVHQFFTRSTADIAVTIFISQYHVDDCFDELGNLDKNKFNAFLKERIGEDNFKKISQSHLYKYISCIKLNRNLGLIRFNNYNLDVSNKVRGIKSKLFQDYDKIKNKFIRKNYNTEDIIAAKDVALKYFKNLHEEKINTISNSDDKHALISQIIFSSNIINISTRNLIENTLTYDILSTFLKPVFDKLNISTDEEKYQFLNNLILINYHRNVGMYIKRIPKAIAFAVLISLPLAALAGMLISGASAGINFGWFAACLVGVGAVAEVGGDFINYGGIIKNANEYTNSGDSLKSTTQTYKSLENFLLNGLENKIAKNYAYEIMTNEHTKSKIDNLFPIVFILLDQKKGIDSEAIRVYKINEKEQLRQIKEKIV